MSINNLTMEEQVSLLQELYRSVSSQGINGDTTLAHINEEEAALLKAHGGSGTVNSSTGLIQYDPGTVVMAIGAGISAVGTMNSMKAQKKQASYQRSQVDAQNKADAARNRYNQLQQKRQRLSEIRQGRIRQGQVEAATGGAGLGAGGTSSFSGAVGSIGTQVSANLGNINVAEDVGNQITGLNQQAANYGSMANSQASKSNMWNSMSSKYILICLASFLYILQ